MWKLQRYLTLVEYQKISRNLDYVYFNSFKIHFEWCWNFIKVNVRIT